ncbi:MAG TPA: hypothetical protein VKV15_09670 [Bryobacteraceae bacterium]|nr:hypothetical protein [Bryobacteraceae bacterium]
MKRRALYLLAVSCVFFAWPTRGGAQSAAASPTPTVQQILDRSVTASGGKDAWMQLSSTHLKGSVEVSGATVGVFEKFDKAPNKSFQRIELGPAGVALRGFDGANGWKADPGHDPEDLQGDELEDAKLDADFYGQIRIDSLYPKLALQGESVEDGRNCYAVVGTPEHGTPRTFYFDKETGMLIGLSGETKTDGKTTRVDSFLEDFKPVKGIQSPFTIRMKTEAATIVIHLHTVEMNQVIMNMGFLKPASRPTASASVSYGAAAGSSQSGAGASAGNTYTDHTYGFSYTYPVGWTVHGDATNKAIMDAGRRIVAGQGPMQQAVAEAAFQRTSLLLSVFQYPLGTPGVKNENILVMAERVDFAPGIRTGEDYLRDLKANYRRAPLHYVFSDSITQYTIGGRQFYRLDNELQTPAAVVYQAIVSTKIGGHVLSFMFSSTNQQDLEGLVGTINSVRFE